MVAETPAIVCIFIVDTDEEAGVEVLQEIAYELATREDDVAQNIRDNMLVIMAPLTNPDSHARYVTWHKLYDVDGASVDPYAVENRAHWGMNTDGNALGIDVNRDFGFFVSPRCGARPDPRALATATHPRHPQWSRRHFSSALPTASPSALAGGGGEVVGGRGETSERSLRATRLVLQHARRL